MRSRVIAAVALAMAGSFTSAAQAAPGAAGFTCSFVTTNDPTGAVQENPDVQFGEMDGGPFVVADDDNPGDNVDTVNGDTSRGAITCAIQINSPLASGADVPSATASANGAADRADSFVVVLPPTQITYTATPTDNVYLCTTWRLENAVGQVRVVHYDAPSETFVADPGAATCPLAISAGG